jgi:hypothetical protein
MINSLMNSRFNLGLRPATASSDALLNRKADGIDGNAPAYPDRFTFETPLVPAEASHSSLFALSSRQERNFRPFVFNHLHTLFHSLQRSDTPSRFFSIASTLFARVPGTRPPSPPNTPTEPAPARPAMRSTTPTRQANWIWSLLAIRLSLFGHIVTSPLHPEKPYPTPYHLMAKRYRTRGLRVCFTNLRFKSILGVSGG